MRIETFRIQNFKSYLDSGVHALADHMNLVVGQNNVGKTAMLQAISTRFPGIPHKDSTMRREQAIPQESSVAIQFCASGQELSDALGQSGAQVVMPYPKNL